MKPTRTITDKTFTFKKIHRNPRTIWVSQQRPRKIPAGHGSQSEADWRGDNPDEIMRRIADYRADDKADPAYYARLTVIKAQVSLMSPGARTPMANIESSRVIDRDL